MRKFVALLVLACFPAWAIDDPFVRSGKAFQVPLGGITASGGSAPVVPAFVRTNCVNGACQTTTATALQRYALTNNTTSGDDIIASVAWKTVTRSIVYVCLDTANTCTQASTAGVFMPFTPSAATGATGTPGDICATGNTGSVCTQIWICRKCNVTAGSHLAVDFSGTTVADVQVAEYSKVSAIGQVISACTPATGPCKLANSASPTLSIAIQDASNIFLMSTASLGSDGVPTSSTGNLRGASRSGTTASFDAGSLCDNSSASAGATVTCTISITSSAWVAVGIELRGSTASDANFIEAVGPNTPASNETGTLTTISGSLSNDPTLANNTIVCAFSIPTGVTVSSLVTTNTFGGATVDTFGAADQTTTGATNQLVVYHIAPTTGVQYYKLTFSSALAAPPNISQACVQAKGVTTTSPVDVHTGTASEAGPNFTAGSMTTTASDWIIAFAFPDGAGNGIDQGSGFCAAGSGYFIDVANPVTAYCVESKVQSATGATNPAFYWPSGTNVSTQSVNVATVAYKTAATGTSPGAQYIARTTVWFGGSTASYIYGNCPVSGNFISGVSEQGNMPPSFLDSNQEVWTNNQISAANLTPVLSYVAGTNLDNSSMCRFHHVDGGNDAEVFRDIAGIATSSPLDTMSTTCPAPSTYAATGCWNAATAVTGSQANLPNIQPSAANELVIAALSLGTGPTSGTTAPSGAVYDIPYFTGMTDTDAYSSGMGDAHFWTTGTGALNFTWTLLNNTSPISGAWALKHL